jgi:excisionase family DNA binding protein
MEERYLSLSAAADALDISERTAYRWIKSGKLRAYKPGRDYRIPEAALKEAVEESEVHPKARRSSPEPSFDDVLGDERRAAWEAAVAEERRLRDTGHDQMWKALSEWRVSRQRKEPEAARRRYLDEMGDLLQEVYEAYTAVGEAYIEAALTTPGGSDASGPSYLREESRVANDFYVELFGLVRSAGLAIRTGDDAAAAKRTAKAQPEGKGKLHEVKELAA